MMARTAALNGSARECQTVMISRSSEGTPEFWYTPWYSGSVSAKPACVCGGFEPRRSRHFHYLTSQCNLGLSETNNLIINGLFVFHPEPHFEYLGQSMTSWEHFL